MAGRSWLRARGNLLQAFMAVLLPCLILSLLYVVLSHSVVDNTLNNDYWVSVAASVDKLPPARPGHPNAGVPHSEPDERPADEPPYSWEQAAAERSPQFGAGGALGRPGDGELPGEGELPNGGEGELPDGGELVDGGERQGAGAGEDRGEPPTDDRSDGPTIGDATSNTGGSAVSNANANANANANSNRPDGAPRADAAEETPFGAVRLTDGQSTAQPVGERSTAAVFRSHHDYEATLLKPGQVSLLALADEARRRALETLPTHFTYLLGPSGKYPTPTAPPSTAGSTLSAEARYWSEAPTLYDDLSGPAQPLTEEEIGYWGDTSAPTAPPGYGSSNYELEESGVRAVVTKGMVKFGVVNRNQSDIERLSAKYCGQCRRYMGGIPNRGARLGHYFHNWLSVFSFARDMKLTLLYHPIVPNQRERQLFDRFFGFGYPEHHFHFEACANGSVGVSCNAFLPCLQVKRLTTHEFATAVRNDVGQCDIVYDTAEDRYPSGDRRNPALYAELRARFHRARSLDPLPLHFSEEDINIAVHARRGDVANAERHKSRITDDETYYNVITGLVSALKSDPVFGSHLSGRIRVHLYSQGKKEDFPALLPLEEEGLLHFHLDQPLLETLYHLTVADILVCAKSGFSTLTGILREPWQPTFYPSDTFTTRLPSWVQFDGVTGDFVEKEAATVLNMFFGSLERRHLLLNLASRKPGAAHLPR